MSAETVLSRMMSEPAFADAVFADAANALTEYNLTADDLAKFKGLSRAQFTAMTTEERRSFGVIIHERSGGDENHNETALVIR